MFGCGADELLELVAKAFLRRGRRGGVRVALVRDVPDRGEGHGRDPGDGAARRARSCTISPRCARRSPTGTRVVFVCNPNNPTGTSVGAAAFDAFVASLPAELVLVVDEAYREFARRARLPRRARLGAAPARHDRDAHVLEDLRPRGPARRLRHLPIRELADYLNRARHPFNVNRLAAAAALAALDDDEHAERSRRVNAEGIDVPHARAARARRRGVADRRELPARARGRGDLRPAPARGRDRAAARGLRHARPRARHDRAARGERAAREDAAPDPGRAA